MNGIVLLSGEAASAEARDRVPQPSAPPIPKASAASTTRSASRRRVCLGNRSLDTWYADKRVILPKSRPI